MSSPFSFNFLPSVDEPKHEPSSPLTHQPGGLESEKASFSWIPDLESKFHEKLRGEPPHDCIPLKESINDICLRRVRETTSSLEYQNTDLVPGVYEGGLKVWECSIDLCRYLQDNSILVEGSVLELGCGHGLPGCWVLNQALSRQNLSTSVIFSDFNEFVLNDATIANIVLNTQKGSDDKKELASRLSRHAALGAGDWNIMSRQFSQGSEYLPSMVPKDGRFDFILAAETTYSTAAAVDTARLLVKHLKVGTGVAFIATKRYYFGVGGGSDCFRDALIAEPSPNKFQVETLEVYDNGAGNIRELLKVNSL
jgi:predicted nicotinamide N-methyase